MQIQEVNLQSGVALALACMHKSIGPSRSAKNLAFTIAALQTLGRHSDESLSIWILHSVHKMCNIMGSKKNFYYYY